MKSATPTTPENEELREKLKGQIGQDGPYTKFWKLYEIVDGWYHVHTRKHLVDVDASTAREMIENIQRYIASEIAKREEQLQTDAVAWVIGVVDLLHESAPASEDRTFKGVKNMIRDAYKARTGVDPAPSYPIKARLAAQKGNQS